MALTMQRLAVGLLRWAFLLPPGGWAGEIIGGREAQPHSRPYMANLDIQDGKDRYSCGGFLVVENFVLTAAHCQGESITVTLGAHNIQKPEPRQQAIPVRWQIPHQQYDSETVNNDIMLLQLSRNVTLTEKVGLVSLTTGHRRVSPGTVCNVAGWGWTSVNTATDTLQEVNLTVMSDSLCQARYDDYFPSTVLCVGDPHDPKSTYLGDSGGPLVCGEVAEGIVSFGANNSTVPPVVFTRISQFIPWIKANMPKI